MLSAVSAHRRLAADLADDSASPSLGFVHGDSLVAYTRPDRLSANNVESLTSRTLRDGRLASSRDPPRDQDARPRRTTHLSRRQGSQTSSTRHQNNQTS